MNTQDTENIISTGNNLAANGLSIALDSPTIKSKKVVTNHKDCLSQVNVFLKANKLNEIVKIKYSNNLYTLKVFGRVYLMTYLNGTDFKEYYEIILKRLDAILRPESTYSLTNYMNGKQRKFYFKKQNKTKKIPSYLEWFQTTSANNIRGQELAQTYLGAQIKKNIEFLIDRETEKRAYLNSLNLSKKDIEKQIESWYSVVLKENSFMSEK